VIRPAVAWVGLAAAFSACALAGFRVDREAIDWQPSLALSQPWRAFTAIGVHYSVAHLVGNLAAAALAAALGAVARAPTRLAIAWLVAWPLTQFGLLLKPALLHYGGLSGVLHAGVAIVVVYLLVTGTRAQRWVAAAIGAGLVAKLLSEAPWGPAIRQSATWDIAVAPLVHSTGALAGAACALLVLRRPWHAVASQTLDRVPGHSGPAPREPLPSDRPHSNTSRKP
jgi:rhomboid family GlyGly-CTERM serine protease